MDSSTGVASGDVRSFRSMLKQSKELEAKSFGLIASLRWAADIGPGASTRLLLDPKRTFDVHELRPGWAFPSQPILNFKSDAVRFCGGHPIEG